MTEVSLSNNAVAMTFENVPVTKQKSGNRRPKIDPEKRYENSKSFLKKTIQRDGGRFISFGINDMGILAAGVEKNHIFYFIYVNKDRQIKLKSTKSGYKLLREVPNNLSVLNYLYQNQRNFIRGLVEDWLDDNENEYTLITDIGIHSYNKRKSNNGKKNTGKKNESKSVANAQNA